MTAPSARTDLDDLLGDEAVNHPARFYGRLRASDPVHFNPRWNGWVLTSYADVIAGFHDHARLSSDRFAGPWGRDARAGGDGMAGVFDVISRFFVWQDPPEHTRVRSYVAKAFTPRSVELLRPRVRTILESLMQELPRDEPIDFVRDFAFHVPVIVISEYLGVPSEARAEVKTWSEALGSVIFVKGDDSDRVARADRAVAGLVNLLRPIVRARKVTPQDDLISGMVHARDPELGEALSEDEIISNAILMLFAGHETTMNLLANGVVAFHEQPAQWRLLQERPDLARSATEEALRYDGPIRAMARWAREPLEIGGKQIATGDRVLLVQWAANRDPMAFPDPDRFDIARTSNRHVAFGHGIHTCLGAALARMETQEAFGHLATHLDGVEVVTQDLRYTPTIVSRSLDELRVVLTSRR